MLDELTRYYNDNRILSTNFDCKFLMECSRGDPNNLIKGKSAYIGKYYEVHSLPRILFLSLDMGSDKDFETEEKKSPLGVRRIEENRDWKALPSLLHWYETHNFALKIAEAMGLRYSNEEANHIFAHTNSAKCCENKKGNDMSRDLLYDNCRNFCKHEIEILKPEIIVGQGGKAYDAVRFSFKELSKESRFSKITDIHEKVHVFEINNQPTLFLQTTYPTWRNRRTLIIREELYPYYLAAVKEYSKEFISR